MSGALATPRIRVPRSARRGEPFEVRCLMAHPMETGHRQDGGQPVPRNLLDRLVVRVDGAVALDATLRNGTAANPYHVFFLRLDRTAEIEFTWSDEAGRSVRAAARVTIA